MLLKRSVLPWLRGDVRIPGAGMLAAAGAALALGGVLWLGAARFGAAPTAAPVEAGLLTTCLLALALIITLVKLLGFAAQSLGQPSVIGKIGAGLLLGPSVLGHYFPALSAAIFPPQLLPALRLGADVGVVLYMFNLGLDFNPRDEAPRGAPVALLSAAVTVLPLLCGALLALWLYPDFGGGHVSFAGFALFLGIVMAATAFPTLVLMLRNTGLGRHPLSHVALACAEVADVSALAVLAAIFWFTRAPFAPPLASYLALIAALATARYVLRPWLAYLGHGSGGHGSVVAVLVAALAAALVTAHIGLHALFGAFVVGLLVPRGTALASALHEKIRDFVRALFLPVFFVYVGMNTHLQLLNAPLFWLALAAIVFTAYFGKFISALLVAKLGGIGWRDASAMGVLLNTRGLLGLIILTIGLERGYIGPALFSILVVTALTTTLLALPLIRWFAPGLLQSESTPAQIAYRISP